MQQHTYGIAGDII